MMTEGEIQLSLAYTGAFKNKAEWTPEDHLAGLKAVFAAGVETARKADAAKRIVYGAGQVDGSAQ